MLLCVLAMNKNGKNWQWLVMAIWCLVLPQGAQAQLFADNEARTAILDLRQRYLAVSEENAQLRQSVQDLQKELRALGNEQARLRGRYEQLVRDVQELRRHDAAHLSPPSVAEHKSAVLPGQAQFDQAIAYFRQRDYSAARASLQRLIQQVPHSPLRTAAQFWLGQSEYALRRYRAAAEGFRAVVELDATHKRAPEALLGVANSQARLGLRSDARTTLEQIVQQYPQSEAAQVARDRLKRMR